MGLVSIMPQITSKTKQMPVQRRLPLIWGGRNDVSEFYSSRHVTEALVLLVPDADGSAVTQRIVCMLVFRQFWFAVWLSSKLFIIQSE